MGNSRDIQITCRNSPLSYPSSYLSWSPGFRRTMANARGRRDACEQRLSAGFTMAASSLRGGLPCDGTTLHRSGCAIGPKAAAASRSQCTRSAAWSFSHSGAYSVESWKDPCESSGQVPANLSTLKAVSGSPGGRRSHNVRYPRQFGEHILRASFTARDP